MAAPALPQTLSATTSLSTYAVAPCTNPSPVREFGQPTLINPQPNSAAPNLVIGQELYSPSGIAFDNSVDPPHVYVVDTGNNRVLGWSNANNVTQGNMADMVLGQQPAPSGNLDFTATLPWGPGSANPEGLNAPTGIAVETRAATSTSRIPEQSHPALRGAPYKQQAGNLVVDLVIGQKSVNSGTSANQGQSNPTASTLYLDASTIPGAIFPDPAGLAVDSSGNLWAADVYNNRVLMYPAANLTSNNSSVSATVALGQSSLTSGQAGGSMPSAGNFLQYPTGVSVDSKGTVTYGWVRKSAGVHHSLPGRQRLAHPGAPANAHVRTAAELSHPIYAGRKLQRQPSPCRRHLHLQRERSDHRICCPFAPKSRGSLPLLGNP